MAATHSAALVGPWQHGYISTNGIRLHYVTQGEGDLVVLLHGFPEFWYSWRHQIPALACSFRVVVPDLRGYNDSDKPDSGYDIETLTADVRGLVEGLGEKTAMVVAHDWGGAIAWHWAEQFPEQVRKLVVLNSPHPACFRRELLSNVDQLRRSWYMLLMQLPLLPEWLLQSNLGNAVRQIFRETAIRKGAFSKADLEVYRMALSKPKVLTSAMNYYRQMFHWRTLQNWLLNPIRQIQAPTLLIWGEEDFALSRKLTENMESFFTRKLQLEIIRDCGHWAQQEAPQTVNRLLLEFLGR
ncbi:alpha/beta fold hydrolase [Synechococcus sp. PCC 7336]|uniref:alpha/beta fold hydrolase n=1 Tax=Synechococcus sp. PCC 7336 TaxID=195250 RepID=UPI0003483737|nr:alpha/beta hydrolase [Synechococcus sp. PCC 7336]